MFQLLQVVSCAPFLFFLSSLVMPPQQEKAISKLALICISIHGIMLTVLILWWLFEGGSIHSQAVHYAASHDFSFDVDFHFDLITAAFGLAGQFVTMMVILYSRYYLHREPGFKRFFSTILFFYAGYCMVVYSGNLETMFIGWEVLGVTSFLLIAFYRDRYLPVKNALKVFSLYRLGDMGLLLAIWAAHHIFSGGFSYSRLTDQEWLISRIAAHPLESLFMTVMILLAAAVKSAQMPFSCWLPRAMEGPTSSSAIFYGALAVNMGVFLLLRFEPFWQQVVIAPFIIAFLGIVTSVLATMMARVQSAIKAQIAYASIAQIGLIFVEVALGLDMMALIHFAGNAFLRTYQLLVSPSVVAYLIREQGYQDKLVPRSMESLLPERLRLTLYFAAISEFGLDRALYNVLWKPLKGLGRKALSVDKASPYLFFLLYCLLLAVLYLSLSNAAYSYSLSICCALLAFMFTAASFAELDSAMRGWARVNFSHFWVALAIAFNAQVPLFEILLYLSGVTFAALLGSGMLFYLKKQKHELLLHDFHGFVGRYPAISTSFLIASLCSIGFPISPTLLGEDLMFSHIHGDQPLLAAILSINFIVVGLSVMRIYARIFLGNDHSVPGCTINRSA